MTESSFLWDSGAGGDASPHSEALTTKLFGAVFAAQSANKGVLWGMLNALKPSISGTNILLDTGFAIVDGHPYYNDASKSTAITTPSVGTTGRRLVLRCSWSAQTVRATIISSADGTSAIPAMTQTPGTTYDVPICSFTTTTGGVSTITADDREYVGYRPRLAKARTTAQSAVATTTYAAVAGDSGNLSYSLKGNEYVKLRWLLHITATGVGSWKFQITGPASPISVRIFNRSIFSSDATATAGGPQTAFSSTISAGSPGSTQTGIVEIEAIIKNGPNEGTVQLEFAQNSASGTSTIGSAHMEVEPMDAAA